MARGDICQAEMQYEALMHECADHIHLKSGEIEFEVMNSDIVEHDRKARRIVVWGRELGKPGEDF